MWWLELAAISPCMFGQWMKRTRRACTDDTWDAKVVWFDGVVITDWLLIQLDFPVLMNNQKIFLCKNFMLYLPLATIFGCVNSQQFEGSTQWSKAWHESIPQMHRMLGSSKSQSGSWWLGKWVHCLKEWCAWTGAGSTWEQQYPSKNAS